MNEFYNIVVVVKVATAVGGGVSIHEQRSRARSRRGGVSENQIAGATAARLFFLTAVAIALAKRPFKFHEISVSNTSSSFVSSIHSFECEPALDRSRLCSAFLRNPDPNIPFDVDRDLNPEPSPSFILVGKLDSQQCHSTLFFLLSFIGFMIFIILEFSGKKCIV